MKTNLYIPIILILISASCSNTTMTPLAPPKLAKIMLTSGVTNNLNSVFFEDTQNGFAVGDSGTIITTTNGGESWSKVQTNFSKRLYSCVVYNGKKYIGGDGIVSLGDGIESIADFQNVGSTMVNSFTVLNDGRIIAVGGFYAFNGSFGKVLVKNQNSNTWSYIADSLFSFGAITDIITKDSSNVLWCVPRCYFCNSGISSFNFNTLTMDTSLNIPEFGMKALSKSGSVIVSVSRNEGIARSTNIGATWYRQAAPNNAVLSDVTMISPTTGYACGEGGVLLITEDSGQSWSAIQSGTTKNLHSIFFPTTTVGFAVGDEGTIIKIDLAEN